MKKTKLILPLLLLGLGLTGCKKPTPSSIPTSVFVQDPEVVEFLNTFGYTLDPGPDGIQANINIENMGSTDDRIIISSLIDTSRSEYVIPSHIRGLPVTTIGERAFRGARNNLTMVVLPSTISSIEEDAFADCNKLGDIIVSSDSELQYIGSGALDNTAFLLAAQGYASTSFYLGQVLISVPDNLTGTYKFTSTTSSIYDGVFSGLKNLDWIELPLSLKSIGKNAFEGSGISEITIPDSVTSIGVNAFKDCLSLTKIQLPANQEFEYPSSAAYLDGATAVSELSYDGNAELANLFGKTDLSTLNLKKVTLRDQGNHQVVKNALSGIASIEEIIVEDGIKSIGKGALAGTNLNTLILPADFEYLADSDLDGTPFYTSLPNNQPIYLGKNFYGFKGAIPTNFVLSSDVKGLTASSIKDLATITALPEGLHYLGDQALLGNKTILTANLPELKSAGIEAFKDCTLLNTVTISADAEIGKGLFYNCQAIESINMNFTLSMSDLFGATLPKIKHLDIAEGLTAIRAETFANLTSLESVSLPSTLTSIGNYAFMGCSSLKEISIPETVSSIGAWAFARCTSLKKVNFEETTMIREENGRFYPMVTLAINTWAFAFNTSMDDEFVIPNRTMRVSGNILFGSSVKHITIQLDEYYLNGVAVEKFDPYNELNAMKYTDGWNETETTDSYGNQERIPYKAVIENFPR